MNGKPVAVFGAVLVVATAAALWRLYVGDPETLRDEEHARELAARVELTARLQAKLTAVEAELTKAREEATKSRAEKSEIASLQARLAAAKEEIKTASEERTKLYKATSELFDDRGSPDGENHLVEVIASTKAQVEEMHRKILELTRNIENLATALAAARKERDHLHAENQRLKNVAMGGVNAVDRKLDGVLTSVTREVLVEISLGSDDGVRRGTTLDVVRGDKSIGRIEILHASPHVAIGRELGAFKQSDLEKNDQVVGRSD
jgi:chaperonin cofactor prefoldin